MKKAANITLKHIKTMYTGVEGELWGLLMGEQSHIGGLASSMVLAEKAGIGAGMHGVDLGCGYGASMRFLVRSLKVARMVGVDIMDHFIKRGREWNKAEGLSKKIDITLAQAGDTGLADHQLDFIWGEDAWCFVENKPQLFAETSRLVKSGGVIAFTDWIEGSTGLSVNEAERFLNFMKFPNLANQKEYADLLLKNDFEIILIEDTGLFADYMDLYLMLLTTQFKYDFMRLFGYKTKQIESFLHDMEFLQESGQAGKITQGRFIAKRK